MTTTTEQASLTSNSRRAIERPYWQLAILRGWLLSDPTAYAGVPGGIREQLNSLTQGNVVEVVKPLQLDASYEAWAAFLGWLSGQGVFDDDEIPVDDLNEIDRIVLDFALEVNAIVMPSES